MILFTLLGILAAVVIVSAIAGVLLICSFAALAGAAVADACDTLFDDDDWLDR